MIESLKVVRSNSWKPYVWLLGRVETAPGTVPPEGTVVDSPFAFELFPSFFWLPWFCAPVELCTAVEGWLMPVMFACPE